MSFPTLVDDSNYLVQYQAGWIWDPNAPNYVDNTRHSSAGTGNTAWLTFSGTGIQVFGTLEPSVTSGQPTTAYTIDDVWHGTYTAPYTASGNTQYNVTFFSKLDLPPGSHQISILNTNGTSPNIVWLDYLLVYPSPSSSPHSTVVTSPAAPPAPSVSTSITTVHTSIVLSDATTVVGSTVITSETLSITNSITTSPSSTGLSSAHQTSYELASSTSSQPTSNLISASVSSSPTTSGTTAKLATDHVDIIVGTVIGAVVLVFLTVILALIVRKQHRQSLDGISPFVSNPNSCSPTTASADTTTHVYVDGKFEERSPSTSSGPVSPVYFSPGSVTTFLGESARMTDVEPLRAEVATAPWYTTAGTQSRARVFLQAFAIRGMGGRGGVLERDVDSGLRRYDQPALPPPYTAE